MNYNDLGVEFKYLIVNEKDRKFGLSVNTVGSIYFAVATGSSVLPSFSMSAICQSPVMARVMVRSEVSA